MSALKTVRSASRPGLMEPKRSSMRAERAATSVAMRMACSAVTICQSTMFLTPSASVRTEPAMELPSRR